MSYLDDYQPVEDRLREFKDDCPESRVTTELVTPNAAKAGDVIIFRCEVFRLPPVQTITVQGATAFPDATGYAHQRILEAPPNKRNGQPNTDSPEWTSPWEVCETSAIGRALANLGYAPKGKRPSREEVSKAEAAASSPAAPTSSTGKGEDSGTETASTVAAGESSSPAPLVGTTTEAPTRDRNVSTIASGQGAAHRPSGALGDAAATVAGGATSEAVGVGEAPAASVDRVEGAEVGAYTSEEPPLGGTEDEATPAPSTHVHHWVDSPKLSKYAVCDVEGCLATERKSKVMAS